MLSWLSQSDRLHHLDTPVVCSACTKKRNDEKKDHANDMFATHPHRIHRMLESETQRHTGSQVSHLIIASGETKAILGDVKLGVPVNW